ncbi:GNAT family N-acetyltransferase [Exilibacterium tricleocarpae]|uniref:GNAT family N-acetyltransferase n=2 Tax=Exilibacterium tricleocarpae TaxID=2591008 RepID=A0A545SQP2_9GAMM|nr:GNAT family N-acetyltransferase [Exilibacterium tricleocarpae]
MAELRPHLQAGDFVSTVRHMETEGYRLAFIERGRRVVAVAGYRITTNLFMGKNLYVDDLVTAADARSEGHGEALVSWLRELAIAERCEVYHLDSGTQRHRAHKFYFREGFNIASYHFSQPLQPG